MTLPQAVLLLEPGDDRRRLGLLVETALVGELDELTRGEACLRFDVVEVRLERHAVLLSTGCPADIRLASASARGIRCAYAFELGRKSKPALLRCGAAPGLPLQPLDLGGGLRLREVAGQLFARLARQGVEVTALSRSQRLV